MTPRAGRQAVEDLQAGLLQRPQPGRADQAGPGDELDEPDAEPVRGEVTGAFLDGLGHLGRRQRRAVEQEPPDLRLRPVGEQRGVVVRRHRAQHQALGA